MALDKDLKQIIDVLAGGVETLIEQLKDGFQYTDIFALVPVLSQIPEAIKDADNAWNYLKAMDETKRQEVIDGVVEKLGDNANVREGAERVMDAAASVYMLYLFAAKAKAAGSEEGGTTGGRG